MGALIRDNGYGILYLGCFDQNCRGELFAVVGKTVDECEIVDAVNSIKVGLFVEKIDGCNNAVSPLPNQAGYVGIQARNVGERITKPKKNRTKTTPARRGLKRSDCRGDCFVGSPIL